VLGVSNHDLKNILDLWFSVGFPIWMISWV
jgi:hypothetical protein